MDSNTLYLIGGFLVLFYAWKRFGPGSPASASVVRAKIAAGATILDVRTSGEFSSGAYPKARNLPVETLSSRLEKVGPKDRSVVVYCASGSRSAQAAKILKAAGFADVTNAGGFASMPR